MRNWQARLDQLSQQGMLRSLRVVDGQGPKVNINGREALLLCSNNYLGIAEHPALTEAMLVATRGRFNVYRSGTINNATMLMILINGLIAGPAVSLYGSPTVSPVIAAL